MHELYQLQSCDKAEKETNRHRSHPRQRWMHSSRSPMPCRVVLHVPSQCVLAAKQFARPTPASC